MTGIARRSPQVCNCSIAAARKVSPAASSTLRPSPLKRWASFAALVVFPVPLTPTIRITNGLAGDGRRGRLTGSRTSTIAPCSASASADSSSRRFDRARRRISSRIRRVASMPTSELSRTVSMSSMRSSSRDRRPVSNALNRPTRAPRVRPRAAFRRPKKPPGFFSSSGAGSFLAREKSTDGRESEAEGPSAPGSGAS